MSNHLLSVGPVRGSNPRALAQQTGTLPTELTRRRFQIPFEGLRLAKPLAKFGIIYATLTKLGHLLAFSKCL